MTMIYIYIIFINLHINDYATVEMVLYVDCPEGRSGGGK